MVNKVSRSAAVFALMVLMMFSGCEEKKDMTEHKKDVFAMDTYMMLKVYGENGDKVLMRAKKEIKELEGLFSVTDEKSDISRINKDGTAQTAEDTSNLIRKSLEYSELTEGALDITVYPVLREWGFTTGQYHIPDDSTVKELLKKVSYKNITVNDGTVTLAKNAEIDLGSVAKGYTSDRLCELFRNEGITSALVNLGGNVQAVGKKPDGSMWRVGVEDPKDNSNIVCTLEIEDKAVITSGNYERFFTGDDGRNYWHIIDPKTGRPADNGLISVTITGDSGTQCDALSTALFVMGTEKAMKFLSEHTEIDAVLIDNDMKVYITEGIEKVTEFSEGYEHTVIKRQETA